MREIIKKISAVWLSALLILPSALAVDAVAAAAESDVTRGAVTMDEVTIQDDEVSIRLSGPVKYKTMQTSNPPRLIIDLLNTEHRIAEPVIEGRGRFLKRVRAGQFERIPKMVSRVVLDLSAEVDYRISGVGDRLIIKLQERPVTESRVVSRKSATKTKKRVRKLPRPLLASASMRIPAATAVPKAAAVPAAALSDLAAMAKARSAVATNVPRARAPRRRSPAARRAMRRRFRRKQLKGDIMSRLPTDRVTLDFEGTDIRNVITLLATKSKVNIIHGADVGGTLTLHLTNVPFDEAFRTILAMRNLTTLQVGDNVLRIITPAALKKSLKDTAGVTKVIPLSYVNAKDILQTINRVRTAEGRTGIALADEKTNSLILTDTLAGIAATERLVAQLDQMPEQIMIEAKLIEVGLNRGLHYGIQWDYLSRDTGRALGKLGETTIGTTAVPLTTPFTKPFNETGLSLIEPGGTDAGAFGRGTGVNLPANSIFSALTLGRVTNNYFLNATITAAASRGKVKVLSDPKIATLNNKKAKISVTTAFPYVTSSVSSTGVATESVSYVTTGIELEVTPTINADGRITLKIKPEVSQPSVTAPASSTGAPGIDSRKVETIVIVQDGETIVIGGLISDTVNTSIAKVPILGDIPILGWLFKKKSITRNRGELLIFVTPKIL